MRVGGGGAVGARVGATVGVGVGVTGRRVNVGIGVVVGAGLGLGRVTWGCGHAETPTAPRITPTTRAAKTAATAFRLGTT